MAHLTSLTVLVIKTNEFAQDLTVKSWSNMDTLVQWTCYYSNSKVWDDNLARTSDSVQAAALNSI